MKPTKRYAAMAATHMVGARTLVMDRPPEMVMHLRPEMRACFRVTREASSQTPSIMTTTEFLRPKELALPSVSRPPPLPGHLRTRMVDLRDALAAPALPPLPPTRPVRSPPSAPPSVLPPVLPPPLSMLPPVLPPPPDMLGARRTWLRALRTRRSLLLIAVSALLLIVFMVRLWSGEGGEGLARAQAQIEAPRPTPAVGSPAPIVSNEQQAPPLAAPTEAQVGALLLSGRRLEALAMYRRLGEMHPSDAGIEAMILVLEQKVATP